MRNIQWKWVLAGIGFIYGAQLVVMFVLQTFGGPSQPGQTIEGIYFALMVLSFFFGGFLVALLSPGETIIEPPLSAIGATFLDLLIPPGIGDRMPDASFIVLLTMSFLLALVGAWIGERMQTPVETPLSQLLLWIGIFLVIFAAPIGAIALGLGLWLAASLVIGAGLIAYWLMSK